MSLLGNIWVKLGLKSDDFQRGMDNAERKTKTFGETVRGITAKVTALVAAFRMLAGSVKTITNFEAATSKLAAVLGTTVDKMGRMTDSAIELGRRTQYTATQVTELQTELAKLGFAEPEILSMQESVLKFAAAVGTDLGSAAARAGATMRGFGLTAEQTGEMLEVMAVSTSKSALSFGYLDSTLGKLVPVARAFGLDTNATITLLGTLANAGIDASSAGTSLRNIFIQLSDSSSKLNQTIGKQPKTMEELIDAFQTLRDKHVGLEQAQALVDKRSASVLLALMDNADACRDLYGELGNANGALDEMYETMTHNVRGAVEEVKSAWEGFVLSLRGSTGILYTVLTNVRDLIGELNYAMFENARNSTEKGNYYRKFSNFLKESADNVKYLDAEYQILLKDAMQKVTDFEGKSWLYRVTNKQELKEAKAQVEGIREAYKQIKGELAGNEAKGGNGVIPTPEDINSLDELLKGLQKKKEYQEGSVGWLREEIKAKEELRDASTDETEIRNLTRQILLLQEKIKKIQELNEAQAGKLPTVNAPNGLNKSPFEIDTSALKHTKEEVDGWIRTFGSQKAEVDEISQGFRDAMMNGVINGLNELAVCIGTNNWDTAALAKAVLSPLADMAISTGVIVSGIGKAIEAFKVSLKTLDGPVAIAAGVALIAAGVMAKAGLAALANGTKGTSSGGSSGGGSPYSYAGGYGVNPGIMDYIGPLEIEVTGTVKGQDLQIALDNYNANRRR